MIERRIEGQFHIFKLARKESDCNALKFLTDNHAIAVKFSGEIRREREQMSALLRELGMEGSL